jgi:hypothetical protein
MRPRCAKRYKQYAFTNERPMMEDFPQPTVVIIARPSVFMWTDADASACLSSAAGWINWRTSSPGVPETGDESTCLPEGSGR